MIHANLPKVHKAPRNANTPNLRQLLAAGSLEVHSVDYSRMVGKPEVIRSDVTASRAFAPHEEADEPKKAHPPPATLQAERDRARERKLDVTAYSEARTSCSSSEESWSGCLPSGSNAARTHIRRLKRVRHSAAACWPGSSASSITITRSNFAATSAS